MEKILVIQLSRMGDLVQTLPLLQWLKRGMRERQITLVCLREFQQIVQGQPWFDRLVAIDLAEVRKLCDEAHRQDFRQLAPFEDCPELAETYDRVINLTHDEASAVLCEKVPGREKCGRIHTLPNEIRLLGDWAKYLFAAVRHRPLNLFNLVDIYLGMGSSSSSRTTRTDHEPTGIPRTGSADTLSPSEGERERVRVRFRGPMGEVPLERVLSPNGSEEDRFQGSAARCDFKVEAAALAEVGALLRHHGYAGKGLLVGLQLGASDLRRAWPVENFAALARQLCTWPDVEVVLTGSQKEAALSSEFLREANGPVIDLIGLTDLRQLPALLATCDLLISNDTGPVHIAAAVGTRVLGLYFSTAYFAETAPYGQGHVVLQAQSEFAGTNSSEFLAASRGEDGLPVEAVQAAVLKMLGRGCGWPSHQPGLRVYESQFLSNGTLIYAPVGPAAPPEYLIGLVNRLMWEQAFGLASDTAFINELFSRSRVLIELQEELADYREALRRMQSHFANGRELARRMTALAESESQASDPAAALPEQMAGTVREISGLGEGFALLADFFHYEIMDLDFLPRSELAQELEHKFRKLENLSRIFLETLDEIEALARAHG